MAYQGINTGTTPNDGTGDTLVAGGVKINSNFTEIYNLLGNGTTLSVGVVSAITAGTNVSLNTTTGNVTVSALTPVSIATTDVDISRNLKVAGITTLGVTTVTSFLTAGITTLGSQGGVTTTGGDLYVGGDLHVLDDIFYDEVTGRNINITGVGTITTFKTDDATVNSSLSIGSTQILSSSRQLSNIVGLDSTTTATIENAIAQDPISFPHLLVSGATTTTTLNVAGLATFAQVTNFGASLFDGVVTMGSSILMPVDRAIIFDSKLEILQDDTEGSIINDKIGSVKIKHANSTVFETTGAGVSITGVCTAASFSGDVNTSALVVSGVSTLGVVTGATYYGNGANLTGIARTDNIIADSLVVSGVSTLGVVTGATYYGNGSEITDAKWVVSNNGSSNYTITGIGLTQTANQPALHLLKGNKYEFEINVGAAHPFQIRESNGGSAYNTGVENNGAAAGIVTFRVPMNAPDKLFYQCTVHAGMGNTIYTVGGNTTTSSVGVGTTANIRTNTLVVTGVSTVGIVTGATYFGDASDITHSSWTLGADGSSHYQFTGPGGLSATADPVIYLARGQNYEFVNNMGAHPFEIRSSNGGSAFSTGVTNNAVSNGTLRFEVPFSAPNSLYYQCTSHAGMGGTIVIYPNLFTV